MCSQFSQSYHVLSNQVAASLRALAVGGGCSHGDEDGDGSGPDEVHPPALHVFNQTVSTLYLNVEAASLSLSLIPQRGVYLRQVS